MSRWEDFDKAARKKFEEKELADDEFKETTRHGEQLSRVKERRLKEMKEAKPVPDTLEVLFPPGYEVEERKKAKVKAKAEEEEKKTFGPGHFAAKRKREYRESYKKADEKLRNR